MSSSAISKLREYFERFPGIGPRQAQRFVYWLLNEDPVFIKNLSETLVQLRENAKQCGQCFRFYAEEICRICNEKRDDSRILVVEKDADMENMEKTGVYDGRYFVLGGLVPFSQKPPKNIRLKELFARMEKESKNKLKEVILAFGATAECDNTVRYIEKILEPLAKNQSIKISRFGRGLSTGAEVEYIDADTLKSALEGRK